MIRKSADIIFLLDATGSMQPAIDAVKLDIERFVAALEAPHVDKEFAVYDWRAAVFAFRDYKYDTENAVPWFVSNPFTRDVSEVKRQLDSIEATGGGDEPESLLDALMKISQMPSAEAIDRQAYEDPVAWRDRRSAARFVIVISDARFHKDVSSTPGVTMDDIANVLMSLRLHLFMIAPAFEDFDGYDDLSMIDKSEYFSIPLEGRTPVNALREFVQDQHSFGRLFDRMARDICKCCCCACGWWED